MRYRYPVQGVVRAGVLAALTIIIASLAPAQVGRAQSAPPPLTPWRGLTDHVGVNMYGWTDYAGEEMFGKSVSADGRYVVFDSTASSLVANDNNWTYDVFVRDRLTGTTTRVSVRDDGSEAYDGISQWASISADGRHVAFASGASLVPEDTNGAWDVYIRDLDTNHTVRASIASDGTQADADSYFPAISANGRFVAFVSTASTFLPGSALGFPGQVYLHDRDTDADGVYDEPGGTETTLVSVPANPDAFDRADRWSRNVRVSADGRTVMFESQATNLFSPEIALDGTNHVYVRDRQTGQTTLIDRAVTGGPSAWGIDYDSADMSDDGRFVTYTTPSQDIVPFDMNWNSQVIRHDRWAAATNPNELVSRLPDGTVGDGTGYDTAVSADGRYIVFQTTSTNLATPAPQGGRGMLVVRDMVAGTFTRVDLRADDVPFDHSFPYNPSISGDATVVVFTSDAHNVLPDYTWGSSSHAYAATAFATDPVSTAFPGSASFPIEGGAAAIEVNTLPLTGWNAVSLAPWIVLTDGAGVGAGPRTVLYSVDSNPAGSARDGQIQLGSMMFWVHQEGDGDSTPPVITAVVTGTQVNGWYTTDVTLHWDISDPESPFSIDWGCYDAAYTTDFGLSTPGCQVTSHGGTSFTSLPLRRDTAAPAITINSPAATVYPLNANVAPLFSCSDGAGSGVASCAASSPVDTSTPGRKTFTVTATDAAGHSSSASVEYMVGTGVCVSPNSHLKAWWRLEGDEYDALGHYTAWPTPTNLALNFEAGVAGQAWRSEGNTYLDAQDYDDLNMWGWALTISAWVRPGGAASPDGATIVSKPSEYRLAVFPDGTLRWAFSQTTGFDWVNTGARLPVSVFSHVAVTYDSGLVKTYVNGRLVHTQQLAGTPTDTGSNLQSLTIGGRSDVNAPFWGTLDEVAIFDGALPASDVEALALAGSGSMCLPKGTTLTMTAPPTVGYMATIPVTLTLQDETGNPLAGKYVSVDTHLTPYPIGSTGFKSGYTDAFGRVSLSVPTTSATVLGTYQFGVNALFDGTADYTPSRAWASMTVVKGTPKITWAPAAMTYGTPLGAPQLNATANTAGTFTYSPAAGTKLDAGNQTLTASFTPDDLTYWDPVTATATLLVRKATPTISISGGTFTYDKAPHTASVTVTGVDGEALSPVIVYYNNVANAPVNAGTYSLSAYYAGSANYNSLYKSSTAQLIVNKYVPTVDLTGGPFTYDAQPHSPAIAVRGAGGDSLVPFSYSIDGVGTASPVQAGTHTVQVTYSGSTNYAAVTVNNLSFVIDKATPLIWMYSSNRFYDGTPQITPAWASGVGSESLTPVVVTYNGSTTAPTTVGSYALVATYGGSTNYNAVSTTAAMTILPGTPWLTWADPAPIVYGTPLGATQLNAAAPTTGRFYYAQPAGTVLAAGMQTLSVLFIPDDQMNWASSNKSVPLTVLKATPAVTWTNPADMVYGAALGADQLNAAANTAGTFTYTPSAGTVLNAGPSALSATFTPADTSNYNSASASVTVNVLRATPPVSWPQPEAIVYGTALGAAQLNATSSAAGTFAYSPAAGTVLPAGAQTLSVAFTPADANNYTSATASVSLDVVKATPVITWAAPADVPYGTPLSALQLNVNASAPGTYEFSPAVGTILPAGSHTLSVVFTPEDGNNFNTATASVPLTVVKAAPIVDWVTPADITYGASLGAAQLTATASTSGTFAYSPGAGSVLPAGTHTLSVTFTPDDGVNYNGATASVVLKVRKATPVVTWPAPADVVYGTAIGAAQLNATADVPGTFAYSPAAGTILPAGTNTLSVTFTPDDAANYSGATATTTLTVTRASTSVTWSGPAAIVYGTPLSAAQLNATASVPGTFAYSPAAGAVLAAGSRTLSVTFTPNDSANYTPSSSSTALTIAPAPLTIRANDAAKPFGQALPAFTSTAIGWVNGDTSGSLSGTAAYATPAGTMSPVGTYPITPSGVWSPNYAITFVAGTLTIVKAATVMTTSASPNPSGLDQPVTFSATVALAAPGGGLPTGFVQFFDGGTLVGTTAIADGPITLTTAGLPAGTHTLTAAYSGDGNFEGSSSTATFVVNTAAASSTVTVSSSAAASNPGQSVTFTAVVSGPAGTISGSVDFYDGATLLGSAAVAGTTASLTTAALATGGHAITARFSGNANVPPSVSPAFAQTVQAAGTKPRSTTTTVSASPSSAALGTEIALTATVTGSQNRTPTGTVLFMANGTVLGSATLSPTGSTTGAATLRISTLPHGAHSISAVYLADASYRASAGTVKATVN